MTESSSDLAGGQHSDMVASSHVFQPTQSSSGTIQQGDGALGVVLQPRRTRSDSDDMVNEYAKIPIALRAQVEAWELNRNEIMIDEAGSEGEGGARQSPDKPKKIGRGPQLKTCKWRGLDCVVKILPENQTKVEQQDMMEELSYVSRLRHPNLVLFLGAVTTSTPLLILHEYLPMGSLEDHVERQRVMNRNSGAKVLWNPDQKIMFRWCLDLAKALSFLHTCVVPVTHRSLDPSNCLLQEDLHLKVSDFGLCKTLNLDDEEGKPIIRSSAKHCWQAPEILNGSSEYDSAVDLYSMGMIYWFIVTGEKPFSHLPQNTVAHAASQLGTRPSLAGIEAKLGSQVVNIMGRLWEHEAALRITAEEVVDILEHCERTRTGPASNSGMMKGLHDRPGFAKKNSSCTVQ